jgi:hypothetical protein
MTLYTLHNAAIFQRVSNYYTPFQAESDQQEACKKFEDITGVAKGELQDLKKRRVFAFKKNLVELAEPNTARSVTCSW